MASRPLCLAFLLHNEKDSNDMVRLRSLYSVTSHQNGIVIRSTLDTIERTTSWPSANFLVGSSLHKAFWFMPFFQIGITVGLFLS